MRLRGWWCVLLSVCGSIRSSVGARGCSIRGWLTIGTLTVRRHIPLCIGSVLRVGLRPIGLSMVLSLDWWSLRLSRWHLCLRSLQWQRLLSLLEWLRSRPPLGQRWLLQVRRRTLSLRGDRRRLGSGRLSIQLCLKGRFGPCSLRTASFCRHSPLLLLLLRQLVLLVMLLWWWTLAPERLRAPRLSSRRSLAGVLRASPRQRLCGPALLRPVLGRRPALQNSIGCRLASRSVLRSTNNAPGGGGTGPG